MLWREDAGAGALASPAFSNSDSGVECAVCGGTFFDEETIDGGLNEDSGGELDRALCVQQGGGADVMEFCRTESITGQTLVVDAGRVFH
jgi:hypothetical protein